MTSLRLGLKLSQNATIDQLREVWSVADDAGFDTCWVMDHFATLGPQDDGPIFEAWAMLAAMAQLTTHTRIGCAVTGNTYRHPAVLAKLAVTVDHLSGGRLEFGIGAGWAEHEHEMLGVELGSAKERSDRLEEAVQVIRSLWTQPRTTFDGRYYRLDEAVAEPKPVQNPYPPIWIGGSGPRRTLRLAARYADVWNAAAGTPEEVAASSAVLDQHCADLGRDPAEIRRSVQIGVDSGDVGPVREAVRAYQAVGFGDIILTLRGDDPVDVAHRLAEGLQELRG